MNTPKLRRRFVTIVIRGCLVRVPKAQADALNKAEREMVQRDWQTNNVD